MGIDVRARPVGTGVHIATRSLMRPSTFQICQALEAQVREELRHRVYGTPIRDWVELVPGELELDAVGLFQLVGAGIEGYGLSGMELVEFVEDCIVSLIRRGAMAVRPDATNVWAPLDGYQGEPHAVAEKIVSQWASGEIAADHDGLWFARLKRDSRGSAA